MDVGRGNGIPGQSKDSVTAYQQHYFMWVCFCPPSPTVESQTPQIGACTRSGLWNRRGTLSSGKLAFTASGSKFCVLPGGGNPSCFGVALCKHTLRNGPGKGQKGPCALGMAAKASGDTQGPWWKASPQSSNSNTL